MTHPEVDETAPSASDTLLTQSTDPETPEDGASGTDSEADTHTTMTDVLPLLLQAEESDAIVQEQVMERDASAVPEGFIRQGGGGDRPTRSEVRAEIDRRLGAIPKVPKTDRTDRATKRPAEDDSEPADSTAVCLEMMKRLLTSDPTFLATMARHINIQVNAGASTSGVPVDPRLLGQGNPRPNEVQDPRDVPPAIPADVEMAGDAAPVGAPADADANAGDRQRAVLPVAVPVAAAPVAPVPAVAQAVPARQPLRAGGGSAALAAAQPPIRVAPQVAENTMMRVLHPSKKADQFVPNPDPHKLGQNSVHPNHTVAYPSGRTPDHSQNYLTGLWKVLKGRPELVEVLADSVVITGTVVMPMYQGVAPSGQVQATFDKTVRAGRALRATTIVWGKTVISGGVDEAVLEAYAPAKYTDIRTVRATVGGTIYMSNALSMALVPLLQEYSHQFDLVGLYTCLWILVDFLHTCDNNALNRQVNPLNVDPVHFANVATGEAQFNVPYQALQAAVYGQYLSIDQSLLDQADVNVMRALSIGPVMWDLAANAVRPIHYWIAWEQFEWMIWHSGPTFNVGVADVPVGDLVNFAYKLAAIFDCHDALVRGFVKASTIVNGVVETCPSTDESYFIDAAMEISRISLPRPAGRNVIWTMITSTWVWDTKVEAFSEDYNTLKDLTGLGWMQLSAASGAVISCAVSTSLNHFNIDGRALNDWAGRVPNRSTAFLRSYFQPPTGEDFLPIHNSVCLTILQTTGLALSLQCLKGFNFCNNWHGAPALPDDDGWRQRWARYVPYLVQPLALEWILVEFALEWGYSGPNPEITIKTELLVNGPADIRGFYIYMGDKQYYDAAQSCEASRYLSYGIHFINTLRGHYRDNTPLPFSYRGIQSLSGDSVLESANWIEDDDLQPEYIADLFCTRAGTIKTYDWLDGRVLGPVLRAARIAVADWRVWSHVYDHPIATYAGFSRRFAPEVSEMAVNNYDIARMLGLTGSSSASQTEAAPTTSKKEEN